VLAAYAGKRKEKINICQLAQKNGQYLEKKY
jgi:hypothetical protein